MLNDKNAVYNVVMPNIQQLFEMIQKNIFRPLPVIKKSNVTGKLEMGMEEEDINIYASWPHLQVFITHGFVEELLDLFDSEEPREREFLKNILHRLYAKIVPRRKMIRIAIIDQFYTLIHEKYKFNGTAELLNMLAGIISGFATPLRDEHVKSFKNVFIPLHKVQTYQFYHEELQLCSMLFLSKDPSLAIFLVKGLLRYWPTGNSTKETMFLAELSEVLDVCDIKKLEPYIPKLFKQLIRCINSNHIVADRALCFFENEYFLEILKSYRSITFPMLVPVIAQISESHWFDALQESLNALKNILKDIDIHAYQLAIELKQPKSLNLIQGPLKQKEARANKEKVWAQLLKNAQQADENFQQPQVPYNTNHLIGKHNGLNNGNTYVLL